MKNIAACLFLFTTLTFSFLLKAQNTFPNELKKALISGSSDQLSIFFSQNVDLLIKNKEDVYSKAQATLIVKDFFNKNVPKDFLIEIDKQNDGFYFTIGNLITSGGIYKVYLEYQKHSTRYYINRLNITSYQ